MLHRHQHHPGTVADRVDALMAAVFVQDEGERLALLALHLAPDFVYITPIAVVDGALGLSDLFSHYRHDPQLRPGLRRTSGIDVHHEFFRCTWERTEHGRVVHEGWAFGQVDESDRLRRVVTFDGNPPGIANEGSQH